MSLVEYESVIEMVKSVMSAVADTVSSGATIVAVLEGIDVGTSPPETVICACSRIPLNNSMATKKIFGHM